MKKRKDKKAYKKGKAHTPQYYVYLVECQDGSYYCGYTVDLGRRITQHQEGIGAKYTKSKVFKKLAYFEVHSNKSWAMKREYEIKNAGRNYKEILVTQFQQNLRLLK